MSEEEELGERWKKFKSESWERTNYTSKFQVLLVYILLCGWNLTTRLASGSNEEQLRLHS